MKMEEKNENTVTRGFYISAMPMSYWMRWNKSCQEDFGDVRWIKVWDNHKKAEAYDILFSQVVARLDEIDMKINALFDMLDEKEEVKEEPKVKTFGGGNEDG